jgi:hypothetical protein
MISDGIPWNLPLDIIHQTTKKLPSPCQTIIHVLVVLRIVSVNAGMLHALEF